MLTFLLALACNPPTTDAYAIGVANLVGRTLRDAAPRLFEGADDPERSWEEAMRFEGSVESAPGLGRILAPWAGAFDLSLTEAASGNWDVALDAESVHVRRFDDDDRGCWDMTCADVGLELDESLHGGCAIDWDPANYALSLALEGTMELTQDPPVEREDFPPSEAGARAWYDAGGGGDMQHVDLLLRAEGSVAGAPAQVVASYDEGYYNSRLVVTVILDGQRAPNVMCGYHGG